jgi:hypothetical protein
VVTPQVTPLGALPSAHPETLLAAKLQLVGGTSVADQADAPRGLYALVPRTDSAAHAA